MNVVVVVVGDRVRANETGRERPMAKTVLSGRPGGTSAATTRTRDAITA